MGSGQPKLLLTGPDSYVVGEQIEPGLTVANSALQEIRIGDLIRSDAAVVVLIVFGGAAKQIPEDPFRGPLWCQDSFDDLAIQRALVASFKDSPVQFIPIAVPPIYSPDRYGYGNVFLAEEPGSNDFRQAFQTFVDLTEKSRESGLLPFDQVYYDPQGLVIRKPQDSSGPAAVQAPSWQGKLKWHLDPRKYGVPTLWILNGNGTVMREPFFGNQYAGDSVQVTYGFQELQQAVSTVLGDLVNDFDDSRSEPTPAPPL